MRTEDFMERGSILKITRVVGILMAVMLTAKLGRIEYLGHQETYYNLNMSRITQRATEMGIPGEYWERADGCKMLGNKIIVATDWNVYPFGSLIETSRGTGIVLDTGEFTGNIVDLAVTW